MGKQVQKHLVPNNLHLGKKEKKGEVLWSFNKEVTKSLLSPRPGT